MLLYFGGGFSSEDATDISSGFKNNSVSCNTGSNTNDSASMLSAKCWKGLEDTSSITFASSTNETDADRRNFFIEI